MDGSTEAIDPVALDRLRRIGGQEFVAEMIDLFLENTPERIRSAEKALQEGDLKALYRAAHSLKSTAANLGARSLQTVAGRLEERAAGGDAEIGTLVEEIAGRFAQVRGHLEAERKRLRAN